MAYTQSDLDAVDRAIATGERTVRFSSPTGDRTVEYRSINELKTARDLIKAELAAADTPPRRVVRLYHGGKGL
ncbi:phage head-tail joining protein [Pseudomonas sp. NPDC086581]|uniref:phage head-tail joining protein n=1 Tax=Pseudomonas sp. NPDC086581 TaxID=3364432 RepID=UPI00381F085A